MHEMGISVSVIEAVEKQVQSHPGARLKQVGLRIGEMSGVDTESLSFCFGCLIKGTPFESAELKIERSADDALDIIQLQLEIP